MILVAKQTNHWQLKAANVTTDQWNHGYKIMIKKMYLTYNAEHQFFRS